MADGIPPPKEDQALGPRQSLRSSFYLALAQHGGPLVRAPTTNLRVLTRWLSMDRRAAPEGPGQIREDSPRRVPILLDTEQVAAITAALRDAIIHGAVWTPSLTQRRTDSFDSHSSGGGDDDDDDGEIGHPNDRHIMFPRIDSLEAGDFRLFFVPGSAPGLPDAPQGHGVSRLSDVHANPWILKADTETFSGPCELTNETTRTWIMRLKITTKLVVLSKQQFHGQNWEQCFSEVAGQPLEQLLIVACSFSDASWSDVHISQMLTVFDTLVDVLVNIQGLPFSRSGEVAGIVNRMVDAFKGVIRRTSNEIRRSKEFTIHPATFIFIQGLEFFFRNRDMVQSLLESGDYNTGPFSDMFDCFISKLTECAETNFQEQGQRYIFVLNNMHCVLEKDCHPGLLPHSVMSKLALLIDKYTLSYLKEYWIPLMQSYLDGDSLKKPRRSSLDEFWHEFCSICDSQMTWKIQTNLKVILREKIVEVIVPKYVNFLVALQESRSLQFPPLFEGKWQAKSKGPEDVTRIMMAERQVPAQMGAYGYTHMHPVQPEREMMYQSKMEGIANQMPVDPASFHQHLYVQQQQQQHHHHQQQQQQQHHQQQQLPPQQVPPTYGFNHIPVMPNEMERMVSPNSVHSDIASPHQPAMLYQLPSGHGMAQYPARQNNNPSNPLDGEGSLSGNSRHREDGQVLRDNMPTVAPVAVPSYMVNVDRMMDSLRVSPNESRSPEQRMYAENGLPQNVTPEYPQSNTNTFFDVNEPKVVPPTEPNPPPSVPSPYMHNVQHANVNHMPHMVSIGGPYPSYVAATIGHGGLPPSAYGVDHAYTQATVNPMSEQKDVLPEVYHKEAPHESVPPLNANSQVPLSTPGLTNHAPNVEQLQESGLAGQQFNNAQALPPRPKRVPSRESISSKDAHSQNSLLNCKGPDLNIPAEEQPYHKDAHAEQARFVKGDGITNPDLLGMEDGLAAFEPPPPLLNEGHGAVTNKVDGQAHTNEGTKSKPVDWISGLPVADEHGRLQIIKNDDLEELQELGSGTFGTVYHGKWRGSDVAIKRINDRCFAGKPSEQDKMRHDFWNEASNLADLHHPNVVAFYGVVLDGPGGSIATVTEYMVNGSLRTALLKNSKSLDRRKRLIIAMDTAFGMEYLHNKNIVHFDLKSDNLLVNLRDPQRPICKVGDLGLSKVKCQTLISGGVRGTLPWMAPELLNGSSSLVSEKVDVFSFGIVLWELLTGEEPYADLHYGVIIGGIVSNTLRPPVPDSCDPEWRSLMEQCWATEPSERPSFTQIAVRLRSMAASQKVQS